MKILQKQMAEHIGFIQENKYKSFNKRAEFSALLFYIKMQFKLKLIKNYNIFLLVFALFSK